MPLFEDVKALTIEKLVRRVMRARERAPVDDLVSCVDGM